VAKDAEHTTLVVEMIVGNCYALLQDGCLTCQNSDLVQTKTK
jgi:hypothetical protein